MFLKRPTEILKSGPNVSAAARVGMPTLTPQSDDATDVLTPGAGLTVVASGGASTGSTGGSGTYVQTVTPAGSGVGDPAVPPNAAAGNPATAAGDTAPGASAQTQSGQGSQAAATPESGQRAQGASGEPPAQSSQPANTGESSSNKKKKKSKKPGPVQAQPGATQARRSPEPGCTSEPAAVSPKIRETNEVTLRHTCAQSSLTRFDPDAPIIQADNEGGG